MTRRGFQGLLVLCTYDPSRLHARLFLCSNDWRMRIWSDCRTDSVRSNARIEHSLCILPWLSSHHSGASRRLCKNRESRSLVSDEGWQWSLCCTQKNLSVYGIPCVFSVLAMTDSRPETELLFAAYPDSALNPKFRMGCLRLPGMCTWVSGYPGCPRPKRNHAHRCALVSGTVDWGEMAMNVGARFHLLYQNRCWSCYECGVS